MRKATDDETIKFANEHCKNEAARKSLVEKYKVEITAFEDMLPQKTIRSHATGNRDIEGSYFIFKVTDTENEIEYFPVFSESVGRKMLNAWEMNIPSKMSIFNDSTTIDGVNVTSSGYIKNATNSIDVDNRNMRILILLVRSLWVHNMNSPKPMDGILKEIYDKLEAHPGWRPYESEIKAVNTIINNYICNELNMKNEKY